MEDNTLNSSGMSGYFPQYFADLVLTHVKRIEQINQKGKSVTIKDLRIKVISAISSEEYGKAIYLLMELIDLKQDILWYIMPADKITQHEMLIRDARNCKKPSELPEPYIIMALNFLRATKALLSKSQFEEIKQYLSILINNFYIQAINNPTKIDELFPHFNSVLINNIAFQLNIPFDEAYSRLCLAKDFANLEDPSRNIVTLVTLKDTQQRDVIVVQGDYAITKLTKNIKNEYSQRAKKKWYTILPDWKKALVELYLPYVLQEDRILPTQLRTILVGLRNTYLGIYFILDLFANKAYLTAHAFHSGTLVALGKDEKANKLLNPLHGEQLQQNTGTKHLLALTLNSDLNPTGNDKAIVEGTSQIAKKLGILHANLPMNVIRVISTNHYAGISDILELVSKNIVSKLKDRMYRSDSEPTNVHPIFETVAKYIANGVDEDLGTYLDSLCELRKIASKIFKEKDLIEISKLCEIIEIAIILRYYINNNKSILDPLDVDNLNLTIGCYANILVSHLDRYQYESIAINSSCESGKDRDGILMFRTALTSFFRFIFNTYQVLTLDDELRNKLRANVTLLARGRHQQFLSGCQGGTCGTFGIKVDSKGAMPKNEFPKEAIDTLIEKPASYNKDIPTLDEICKTFFFPIGEDDLEIQRFTTIHVLKLQQKKEDMILAKGSLFKSSGLLSSRSQLLSVTMKELESATSLEELETIIGKASEKNKKLTEGKLYSAGETQRLFSVIQSHLNLVVKFASEQKSAMQVLEKSNTKTIEI